MKAYIFNKVRVAHNAILVTRMPLATIAFLCKQTTDNFRTRHPPEPRWHQTHTAVHSQSADVCLSFQ